MESHSPSADAATRTYTSWQRKLHSQLVMLLGYLSIAITAIAWMKRKEFQQSPLLPSLLTGLMAFLAIFGIWAFSHLPRSIIVPVHMAGGTCMLALLTWMVLRQTSNGIRVDDTRTRHWSFFAWLGLLLLVVQIMLGSWVGSNFAALACTNFPLCEGSLLPAMEFSYPIDGSPLAKGQLIAIHWMHRFSAVIVMGYLFWLALAVSSLNGMKKIALWLSAILMLQFGLGVANLLIGMPLAGVVLHNALAMTLLVTLLVLNFKLQGGPHKDE